MLKHAVTGEQVKKFIDMTDRETVAELSARITEELLDACKAVGDKYLELEHKFPELMAANGISIIATCNALPIKGDAPICVIVGTMEGIQHAAQPLIKAFSNISQEVKHDKGTNRKTETTVS